MSNDADGSVTEDHSESLIGILTLRFDLYSQQHFENMRQLYFPPERNLVPAHLTLFHSLPLTKETRTVVGSKAASTAMFPVAVTGLRSLGRGVAYTLGAPELAILHQSLSHSFTEFLTPQDKQKFQPHVVIQNKATSEQAKALLARLQPAFQAFTVEAQGLDLWHYRNGPWALTQQFHFKPMHPGSRESPLY